MTVVFVGFFAGGGMSQDGDGYNIPVGWKEPLPEASVIALLLDARIEDPQAINRLRIDLGKAFAKDTRILLCAGPDVAAGASMSFGQWLQSRLGISILVGGPWEIRPAVSELTPYFQEHLAHAEVRGMEREPPGFRVLAEIAGQREMAASAMFSFDKSLIIVIPVGPDGRSDALEFISLMPPAEPYPEYLDEIEFGDEAAIRKEVVELRERLEGRERALDDARKAKQILYFTGFDLEHEVVRFLTEELGTPARHVSGVNEDLHLLKDGGDHWGVGEVKGHGGKNASRPDVAALVFHRHEAGLPEDYPSLLVVNSFLKRTSVAERDQALPKDVVRLAESEHVLVVRTLDLVRLKQLAEKGTPATDEFRGAIEAGGGWFEVTADGQWNLHKS